MRGWMRKLWFYEVTWGQMVSNTVSKTYSKHVSQIWISKSKWYIWNMKSFCFLHLSFVIKQTFLKFEVIYGSFQGHFGVISGQGSEFLWSKNIFSYFTMAIIHNFLIIFSIKFKNETFVWFDKIGEESWGDESDDFDALGKYKNSLFKSSIVIFSIFEPFCGGQLVKNRTKSNKKLFYRVFVVKKGGKMDSFASKLRRMHCSSSSRPTQIISML